MRIPLVVVSIALLASVLSMPAHAGKNLEFCKLMMAKLTIQYEIGTLEDRVAARKGELRAVRPVLDRARSLVLLSYGERRVDMQKKSPGFYDWATLQAIEGLESNQTPDEFKKVATAKCLAEYDS